MELVDRSAESNTAGGRCFNVSNLQRQASANPCYPPPLSRSPGRAIIAIFSELSSKQMRITHQMLPADIARGRRDSTRPLAPAGPMSLSDPADHLSADDLYFPVNHVRKAFSRHLS